MPERTLRQRIVDVLREREADARELSQVLGLTEKEVYAHLSHIERSAAAAGGALVVTPSECLACGYVFAERRRLTRPGRCPRCRQARVSPPSFRVQPNNP
jgi:predicted Zn-ribbon and HTH transcriptional regulator